MKRDKKLFTYLHSLETTNEYLKMQIDKIDELIFEHSVLFKEEPGDSKS